MNIGIIIPTLTIGGGERAALNNAILLTDLGCNVTIFTLSDRLEIDTPDNIRVKSFSGFFSLIKLYLEIKKDKIEHTISMLERANFFNLLLHVLFGLNVTLSVHTAPKNGFSLRRWYKRVFIYLMYRMSAIFDVSIITVSEGIADDLKMMFGVRNATYIQNFLDKNKFIGDGYISSEIKSGLEGNKILFLGRMEEIKGIDVLLEALLKFDRFSDGNIEFVVVGDGSKFNYFLNSIKQLKNIKVSVVGAVDDPRPYLKDADYLVCPSYAEGFSIAILEALYYNCKVIYSRCDFGPREILKEDVNNIISIPFPDPSVSLLESISTLTDIFLRIQNGTLFKADVDLECIKIKNKILNIYSYDVVKMKYKNYLFNKRYFK